MCYHRVLQTITVLFAFQFNTASTLKAEELNTKLPVEQDSTFSVPLDIQIASQPLGAALREFANKANLTITFDSDLTLGKTAPAVNGRMSRKDALQRLLAGSGLQGEIKGTQVLIKTQTSNATSEDKSIKLDHPMANTRARICSGVLLP